MLHEKLLFKFEQFINVMLYFTVTLFIRQRLTAKNGGNIRRD